METEKAKSQYSGFVIIRLSQEASPENESPETLQSYCAERKLRGLAKLLDSYDIKDTRQLVRALPVSKIRELEKQAALSALPPLNSISAYWKLDLRKVAKKKSEEFVKALGSLEEVDFAYRELEATDPAVNAGNDPFNASQNYQDAAPDGIDARWAWTQLNSEGAGVGFVDLEQGWFLNHDDYAGKAPTLLSGDNRDGIGGYVGNHGTAVLGEVSADDNTIGVVGIAPSATTVNVTSHWDTASSSSGNVADAIVGALPTLQPGDVLLLEIQKNLLPTEVDVADFDAIRLAVALGIIVVEAAGNGGNDLDNYTDGGDFVLRRGSADFKDSGAIMVGAATSTVPHNRKDFSNFGSRIDCYAWGENVTTAGYGDLDNGGGDNNKTYTSTFNGTSSASPIISGAALILQGLYKANTNDRLSSFEMRTLLSNPATGTPQGTDVAGYISVMPDLRAIIETTLEIPRLVTLIPDTGDFGNVCLGTFKDMDLILSNSGNARLKVTNITSSSAEFELPSVMSYPIFIDKGDSISIPLRLAPTSFGAKLSTITVLSDNPNGPKKVKVSGTSKAPRLVALIAGNRNFGDVCKGSFADKMLVLNNSGPCPLTITAITSSDPEFLVANVLSFPIVIAPGDAVQVPIQFEPTSFGSKSGTITIASDDPSGDKKVNVKGNVPAGKLAVTGSTCIGGVKACCTGERTISICNKGDCKLRVSKVAFKRKSKYWKLVNNPFPATLQPGSCLSVLIRYHAKEKCPKSCELVIKSDDPKSRKKKLDVMAYTVWHDHGCHQECNDCQKGCCDKHAHQSCSTQSMDACCWDE